MSDPLRWTNPESEATTLERVLIQGEAASGPSEQVVSGVWTKLSAALPPAALVGEAAAGHAAKGGAAAGKVAGGTSAAGIGAAQVGAAGQVAASGSAGIGFSALVKPLILGVALGGGSVAVSQGVKHVTQDKPRVVAPNVTVGQDAPRASAQPHSGSRSAPTQAPDRVEEAPAPPKRGAAAAAGAGSTPEAAAPAEPQSRASKLAAERKRLVEARTLLRAGRAADCLALLDSNAGVGLLGQERLVIRVDALMMLGRKAEAKQLADALIARHPESPYASYLKRVTR